MKETQTDLPYQIDIKQGQFFKNIFLGIVFLSILNTTLVFFMYWTIGSSEKMVFLFMTTGWVFISLVLFFSYNWLLKKGIIISLTPTQISIIKKKSNEVIKRIPSNSLLKVFGIQVDYPHSSIMIIFAHKEGVEIFSLNNMSLFMKKQKDFLQLLLNYVKKNYKVQIIEEIKKYNSSIAFFEEYKKNVR